VFCLTRKHESDFQSVKHILTLLRRYPYSTHYLRLRTGRIIVDADALDGLLALFKNVKEPARRLLKQLAKHESIVSSISQLTAFVCLLKL
jgi:hypothetical protein